ncbi:MAG: hypothetical protein Q9191_000784 [Dirinaria sp. TL-2023a]
MSQQESQYAENLVSWFNSSSNKAPGTSDATYTDTLCGHGIVMNLSERKIPEELTPLKERILQNWSSSQLDDQAVFAIMDATEELAHNSERPTNKILRTPMFPLGTFPFLSFELKAESAGGVLTTAEVQAAGSGSHSVNSIVWLLEEATAAGLTEIDLMRDTVYFSIVSSHRQAIVYLRWLDPEKKHFFMSYLRSYSTFEADGIRGYNNTI